MDIFDIFKTSEADILNNKKTGVIYVADFPSGTGKYVSVAERSNAPDLDIKISHRIHLRVTYLTSAEKISGIEIAKVDGDKVEKIHFSTLDFERILQLLQLFSELDLKSIANKSLVLEKSIIGNSAEVSRFLKLIAADPDGKKKIEEVAKNYGLIQVGDIDYIVQKKEAVILFEKILNDRLEFEAYKVELRVRKDEEVWQKFFETNPWILGSDFVEILGERVIDENSTTDIPVKDYDGFVNIIELKLPTSDFWTFEDVPVAPLTKAIMQCAGYVTEVERRMNDYKKIEKLGASILKPRITLIYGRSQDWTIGQKQQFKILNSSFHDIAILTYDHVINRANRIIGRK